MLKVNNKNTDVIVFIVNFEHISHFFSSVTIADVEQGSISWVC